MHVIFRAGMIVTWGRLKIKMSSYQYRNYKDKTVLFFVMEISIPEKVGFVLKRAPVTLTVMDKMNRNLTIIKHNKTWTIWLIKNEILQHDDVITWKHFPRHWPFVRGIHLSPDKSPHKGQWPGALMLSLISAWINGWVNNRESSDLRRHRAHYNAILMCNSCQVKCMSLSQYMQIIQVMRFQVIEWQRTMVYRPHRLREILTDSRMDK